MSHSGHAGRIAASIDIGANFFDVIQVPVEAENHSQRSHGTNRPFDDIRGHSAVNLQRYPETLPDFCQAFIGLGALTTMGQQTLRRVRREESVLCPPL